jgi:hypothetical protein
MKSALWTLSVVLLLAALAVWSGPWLKAQLRQAGPAAAGQPSEGQVLLSQEWARVHSQPQH